MGLRYGELVPVGKWKKFASTKADWSLTRSDDLIPEEDEVVLLALKRLSQQESYDRVYRLRRALQVHLHPAARPQCMSRSH